LKFTGSAVLLEFPLSSSSAATGLLLLILLNHPEWLSGGRARMHVRTLCFVGDGMLRLRVVWPSADIVTDRHMHVARPVQAYQHASYSLWSSPNVPFSIAYMICLCLARLSSIGQHRLSIVRHRA
jgi:hypothetical protein